MGKAGFADKINHQHCPPATVMFAKQVARTTVEWEAKAAAAKKKRLHNVIQQGCFANTSSQCSVVGYTLLVAGGVFQLSDESVRPY